MNTLLGIFIDESKSVSITDPGSIINLLNFWAAFSLWSLLWRSCCFWCSFWWLSRLSSWWHTGVGICGELLQEDIQWNHLVVFLHIGSWANNWAIFQLFVFFLANSFTTNIGQVIVPSACFVVAGTFELLKQRLVMEITETSVNLLDWDEFQLGEIPCYNSTGTLSCVDTDRRYNPKNLDHPTLVELGTPCHYQ